MGVFRVSQILIISLAVLWTSGCSSGSSRPKLYPVKGQLLVNEKSAEGALLVFHSKQAIEGKPVDRPFAKTDVNGEFMVTTYDTNDGAPEGEYVVTVVWPKKSEGLSFSTEGSGKSVDQLMNRYGDPKTALLKPTIK